MSIDKRKHEREAREEKVFVEVLSASNFKEDDKVLLECTTQDISIGGLKIRSQYPLIVNAILELLISFEHGGYKFLLTGEVKWCDSVEQEMFLAGFELIDAEHSDFLIWQKMFEMVES